MEIKTLSSVPNIPFNDALESFFDTHEVDGDIECYQLFFCPYGLGTGFDDLYMIKFKSPIVILNTIDFMIDGDDNAAIEEIKQFCAWHPEQKFISFNHHLNLQEELKDIPNLYCDAIITSNFTEKFTHCEKKNLTNRWLTLNSSTKLHRVLTVSYLLSKEYHRNGLITFDMNTPTLVSYDKYRNITKIPSYDLRSSFAKGFARFKAKDFNKIKVRKIDYDDMRVAHNYNTDILPVYEKIGVEIITGTMFFEKTPVLSEKELQSIYGKNFPIYINGVGMAREIKKLFDIDIFEDIVDHSYDEIENHFERLAAAIDRNEHLLNGSTNIRELWYDNKARFDENCEKLDAVIHDKAYQKHFNDGKIKKALEHFGVSVTEK